LRLTELDVSYSFEAYFIGNGFVYRKEDNPLEEQKSCLFDLTTIQWRNVYKSTMIALEISDELLSSRGWLYWSMFLCLIRVDASPGTIS
jgi:hypothetical protein